jgi:hypothetical protein
MGVNDEVSLSDMEDAYRDSLSFVEQCIIDFDSDKTVQSCSGYTSRFTESPRAIQQYFGDLRFGRTLSTVFDRDGEASLYTELASDNLYLGGWANYARLGFGSLVSKSSVTPADTAGVEAATDQFFQSGGNAVLFLQIPGVFALQSLKDSDTYFRRIDIYFSLRTGADVPAMGGAIEDPAFNGTASIIGEGVYRAVTDDIRLFASSEAGLLWATNTFYENAGAERAGGRTWLPLPVLKGFFGIEIGQTVRIGATVGGSAVFKQPAKVSVQIIPRQASE